MGRILGRLVVGCTLLLICFISYSSQIFIIWPWYSGVLSVELVALLAPFNILVGMLLWNYYLCVVTDPGRVPLSWKPDTLSGDGYEVKKLTGGPRYCRTCEQYKPPRAHHCRSCNRCVLRMDHHCPWVDNCVGHFNYGHFIRFLFYVDLACSYHLTMVFRRVLDAMGPGFWNAPETVELIFIILNFVTCVPVLLLVGAFSLYHFYSMMGNTTTIEAREKDKAATLVRRGKLSEIKFPYNLGVRRNIESVLGTNPLLWCWPSITPGTGLKFQLSEGDAPALAHPDDQPIWPPHDPTIVDDSNHNHELTLPSTPWTYNNGSLNPDLQPSNAYLRSTTTTRRRRSGKRPQQEQISSVPPYHPDYWESNAGDESISASSDEYSEKADAGGSDMNMDGRVRIRRGSEGYEVRPVDREEMLRRYLQERVSESGRYQRYDPEPESGSEDEVEIDGAVAR